MNLIERIKNVNKLQLLIIFGIFILAFATRAHLMKYELFFEFDSYFHARIISYVIEDFVIPFNDPLRFAPTESFVPISSFWFFSYFTAILYKVFTFGAPYNKDLWIFFIKFFPAFYGALISVAMYFLGREAYSRKAGIAMGVFASVVPAFVYRTMSGFLEEDAFGFLPMIVGFIFLIKAIKEPRLSKKQLKNSVLAGIFFVIMAVSWNLFILIYMIVAPLLVFGLILMILRKNDFNEIKSFFSLIFISIMIFAVFSTLN